jgi:uncharacterized protein YndB with AHSA1/START domain
MHATGSVLPENVAQADVVVDGSPEDVWAVITSPDPRPEVMFGARVVTDWQPGSRIEWRGEWQGTPFVDHGEVVDVQPGRRLEVTHFSPLSGQPDTAENYHRLTYTLTPEDGGTRVRLAQDNNPSEEAAQHSADMWVTALDGIRSVVEEG